MKEIAEFRKKINAALAELDPELLAYDESEFWMIKWPYEYIEYYVHENGLRNTAIALPLARGIHNGTHRKSSIVKNGVSYKLPYVIHCLLVCRMLVDVKLPLSKEEEDIVLAASLCHDMIEDIPFPNSGRELVTDYGLDERVYETVKLVSKRRDFTPEEEREFFRKINENKLALLVKLSDRSHNVEDLYNMSAWKVHEYIGETRSFFMPMCEYSLANYPELEKIIEIFQDKIVSLTQAAEIMVDRCEAREKELLAELNRLKDENAELHRIYNELWKG